MIDDALRAAAKRVLDSFRARGLKVATAESCTGGLVAAALTEIAGSSDVVDCGFVTYSNAAKQAMLGVPEATLKRHGAVSARDRGGHGGRRAEKFAGRCGGGDHRDCRPRRRHESEKPVGLVHFAAASRDGSRLARTRRYGKIGRRRVRQRSVAEALRLLRLLAETNAR